MVEGLNLRAQREVTLEDAREDLLGSLDEPFGPAGLLRLKGGHLNGYFGWADNILQIDELPALHLRAVAEVGVFGESVMLPAASLLDCLASPHPGGSVEVEEDAGTGTAAVLQDEMTVQQNGLNLSKKAV